jgi:hypothetical protein
MNGGMPIHGGLAARPTIKFACLTRGCPAHLTARAQECSKGLDSQGLCGLQPMSSWFLTCLSTVAGDKSFGLRAGFCNAKEGQGGRCLTARPSRSALFGRTGCSRRLFTLKLTRPRSSSTTPTHPATIECRKGQPCCFGPSPSFSSSSSPQAAPAISVSAPADSNSPSFTQ